MSNTKQQIIKLIAFIVLLFGFFSLASALELTDAKQAGLVGERSNGYLAAVVEQPTAEVVNLVNKVNAARKVEYQRIAKKNGTDLAVVEQVGGKEAIARTAAGQYIWHNGKWQKK